MERISCQKCQRLLDERWDGVQLAEADSELVRSHVGSCLACAGFAHDMDKVLGAARALCELTYERPVEIAPLVLGLRKTPPWWRAVATSAAFGLAVAVAFQLGARKSGPELAVGSASQLVLVRVAVPLAGAQSVSLLGDFTGWKNRIPLARAESGLWVGELRVPAGRYRYVLVVDDAEMQPDPAAPQVVDDGFGGKNSVLDVAGTL